MDKWIDVNERMPESNHNVLVYDKYSETKGEICVAEYWDDFNEWSTIDNFSAMDNITHWMELPEPPK